MGQVQVGVVGGRYSWGQVGPRGQEAPVCKDGDGGSEKVCGRAGCVGMATGAVLKVSGEGVMLKRVGGRPGPNIVCWTIALGVGSDEADNDKEGERDGGGSFVRCEGLGGSGLVVGVP